MELKNDHRVDQSAKAKKFYALHQGKDILVLPNASINMQWRICFKWLNNEPHEVEIVDYH